MKFFIIMISVFTYIISYIYTKDFNLEIKFYSYFIDVKFSFVIFLLFSLIILIYTSQYFFISHFIKKNGLHNCEKLFHHIFSYITYYKTISLNGMNKNYKKIINILPKGSSSKNFMIALHNEKIGKFSLSKDFFIKEYVTNKNNFIYSFFLIEMLVKNNSLIEAKRVVSENINIYPNVFSDIYLKISIKLNDWDKSLFLSKSIKKHKYYTSVNIDKYLSILYYIIARDLFNKGKIEDSLKKSSLSLSYNVFLSDNIIFYSNILFHKYGNSNKSINFLIKQYNKTKHPLIIKHIFNEFSNKNNIVDLFNLLEKHHKKDQYILYYSALYMFKFNIMDLAYDNVKKSLDIYPNILYINLLNRILKVYDGEMCIKDSYNIGFYYYCCECNKIMKKWNYSCPNCDSFASIEFHDECELL